MWWIFHPELSSICVWTCSSYWQKPGLEPRDLQFPTSLWFCGPKPSRLSGSEPNKLLSFGSSPSWASNIRVRWGWVITQGSPPSCSIYHFISLCWAETGKGIKLVYILEFQNKLHRSVLQNCDTSRQMLEKKNSFYCCANRTRICSCWTLNVFRSLKLFRASGLLIKSLLCRFSWG